MKSAQSVSQSVSQSFLASGDRVTSVYHDALEDLAARRRAIGDLIVSLAAVAGVDAAPYLDPPVAVSDAEVDAVVEGLRNVVKRAKEPAPPRPRSPAPPVTSEAGQSNDDKVLQALKRGPLAPASIRERTDIAAWALKPVMNRLMTAKKISKSGTGPRNTRYQLTT